MATKKIVTNKISPPWGGKVVSEKPSLEPGSNTTFGQYLLHERLSEPESSPVYRAFNKQIGREEALKFVAVDVDQDKSELYKHELALLGSLDVPGVITVYRCGIDKDEQGREWTYFSMPLVKGKTLDKYVQTNNCSLKEKLELLEKTASIISSLHKVDILHKDLKPANVMVQPNGEVKLLDLGIAGLLEEEGTDDSYHGTPAFSSPEQLQANDLTKATDVYSFATMFFYIISGRHSYLDDLDEPFLAIKEKCLRGKTTLLEDFIPELKGQVSDLVTRALSLEPRLRPSIEQIHNVLMELTTPAPKLKLSLIIGDDCQGERAIVDKVIRNFKVYYGRGLDLSTTYGYQDDADVVLLLLWNNKVFIDDLIEEENDSLKYCLFKSGKDPLYPAKENLRKSTLSSSLQKASFISLEFKDLAELEKHFFRFLRRSVKTLYPECRRLPQRSWEGAPYIGLKTFEYRHAPVFFGRTFAISRALDLLRLQRATNNDILLIHGSSGCGKSSLVRAGVLPILTEYPMYESKLLWDYHIIEFNTKKSSWQEQIRQSIHEKLHIELDESLSQEITDEEIERWVISAADSNGLPVKQSGMIFFFDQLESFFSYENESIQRQLFDQFLERLCKFQNVSVICTLRSDFLPALDTLPTVKSLTSKQGLLQLFPPSEYELNEIIRYPAIAAGLTFEDDPETGMGLEQSLCREAINSPEGLPLLEFLLTELYDGITDEGIITWDKYKKLGGIAGALSQRAEDTLNSLPEECQKALPLVILKLMSYTREKNLIRNWMPLDEAYDNILYRQIIDHFVANRLFTVSRRNENSVVSVSHESLIRSWPRITKLAQLHENFLVFKSNLEVPLRIWEKALLEEKKEHLLSGSLLREGSQLMAQYPDYFTRREKEFLQESMLDKGKQDVIRNRQRLKYAKTLAIISLLTVVITVIFTIIIFRQQAREDKNVLRLNDLQRQRDQLMTDISTQQSELNNLKEQRSLINMANRISRTNQQISQLATRIRKGNSSYLASMKSLESIPSDLRSWEWGYLYLQSLPDYQPLVGHKEEIASVTLSNNEKLAITASWDDTAKVWDANSGKLISTLKHASKGISDVEYAIFAPNDKRAITASSDGFIRIWDFTSNNISSPDISFRGSTKPVRHLSFTPDNQFLISCDDTGAINFWDWKKQDFKTPVSTYFHQKGIRCTKVSFSKNGVTMASSGWTLTPRIWQYAGNATLLSTPEFSKIRSHKDVIRDIAFISNYELVSVSKDKSMIIWNLKTGKKWHNTLHKADVTSVSYLPSLNLIATASKDKQIILSEPYSDAPEKTIKVHSDTVTDLCASKDLSKLFAVSADRTGSIHSISDNQSSSNHIQRDYLFQGLKAYSTSADSQFVFVLDSSGNIHKIDLNGTMSAQPLASNYPLDNQEVLSFKYVKDFDYFIIVLHNGIIIELNSNSRVMRSLDIAPHTASISPDGLSTAMLSSDNKLYLYKSLTESPELQAMLPEQTFIDLCWVSPNKLLLVDSSHIIYEYSLASLTLNELFHSGHKRSIFHVDSQMTPDGPAAITTSRDNKVFVQYLNTMKRIEFNHSPQDDVFHSSLSPDGKRLLTINSSDNTPYIWDALTGEELFSLPSLYSPLQNCSFSPDGSFIICTDQNDTLRIYFSSLPNLPAPQ